MGDITLGKKFNLLLSGKQSPILAAIQSQLSTTFGYLGHLPWVFAIFKKVPGVSSGYYGFWKWIEMQLEERSAREEPQLDVFSWILDAYQQGPKSIQDKLNLHGDTFLSIVAGSDPTATTLTNAFFHLASEPRVKKELQARLDAQPEWNYKALTNLDLLDALINEAFRMGSPAPSGTQRVTPPEGMFIGNTWIPGNVIVQVPLHTVYRDPRCFDRPNEFLPERWTTRPELIRDKSVFIPFNGGPYACAGRPLAMMEIRFVLAEALRRYDIALSPSQTEDMFWAKQKDHYTLSTSPLWVMFTKREKMEETV